MQQTMMSCKAHWFTLPMWTSWPRRWLLLVHRHPSRDHQSFVEVFNDLAKDLAGGLIPLHDFAQVS